MNILLLYQYATWCGLLEASGQRLLKYVGKQFWQCSEHKSSYQRSIAAWTLLNVDRHMMLWLNLKNIVTTSLEQSPDEWVLVLFKKAVHINLIDTEKEQRESHWQGVGERPRWCQAEGNLGSGFVSNGYWAAITKRERIIPKKMNYCSLSFSWNNVGYSLFLSTSADLSEGHQNNALLFQVNYRRALSISQN